MQLFVESRCSCYNQYPVVLQYNILGSGIVCSNCNLLRYVKFPVALMKKISDWNVLYAKVYKKWLDEDKGYKEIFDVYSIVNRLGLEIVNEMGVFKKTYYWWHVDTMEKKERCPVCNKKLISLKNDYSTSHKVCKECLVLVNDVE